MSEPHEEQQPESPERNEAIRQGPPEGEVTSQPGASSSKAEAGAVEPTGEQGEPAQETPESSTSSPDRRIFLATASSIGMAGGLLAGYGTLAYMAGRFLYPSGAGKRVWLFVNKVDAIGDGEVVQFETPSGQSIAITRQGTSGTVEDFLALSSVCPHLGCRVHWETAKTRFFCPCHNGAFDARGKATEGPPAEEGQSLPRYQLRVDDNLLFIEVPVSPLTS